MALDLTLVGVAVILAGFLLILLAMMSGTKPHGEGEEERRREVRGGGVVMIGPIPIIFGSDAKWTSIVIVLAIILMVVSFFLMRYAVF